jgi:PAS domain S-box-containing protein
MKHAVTETDAALLEALLDATVDGIIVADEIGHIVRVNAAASAMFGYSREEMVGQSIGLLMPTQMANLHDGFMQDYLQTGRMKILGMGRELQGQRKDKTVFPLHISVGRADLEGRVLFVSVMHELTGRKAVEAALVRSQQMEAMGRMTGGIAHDFNNVLTVITASLELAVKQLHDPNIRPLIEDALRSAETGANLVDRMLSFARKHTTTLVSTDVNDLVEHMRGILQRLVGEAIQIETRLPFGLAPALTDPAQLQSAIMNLVTNARDAIPEKGEIRIETSLANLQNPHLAAEIGVDPGMYVCLTVSDRGRGMTKEMLKQAFDPFFSTKLSGLGTGLGLSMVYGFAKHSGGHASIQSQPGSGTTVSLFLPCAAQDQPVTGTARQSAVEAPAHGPSVPTIEAGP